MSQKSYKNTPNGGCLDLSSKALLENRVGEALRLREGGEKIPRISWDKLKGKADRAYRWFLSELPLLIILAVLWLVGLLVIALVVLAFYVASSVAFLSL